jgi:sortase A
MRHRLGSLFLLAGLAALGWCGALVTDALLGQRWAQQQLALPSSPPLPAAAARGGSAAPEVQAAAVRRAPDEEGSAIARLSIPRIGLAAAVLHGSDDRTLRRGPGHLENTALPGEPGNVVIAGHRDTFFLPLRRVAVGDDIYLATASGRFHYRVAAIDIVGPREVSVLEPTPEPTLTLITCYPFWVLGHAPERFVVRAESVDPIAPSAEEVLVREEIDRFQAIYNARLLREGGDAIEPALWFRDCSVTVGDAAATASCEAPRADQTVRRTFTLERRHDGWAIRSVAQR